MSLIIGAFAYYASFYLLSEAVCGYSDKIRRLTMFVKIGIGRDERSMAGGRRKSGGHTSCVVTGSIPVPALTMEHSQTVRQGTLTPSMGVRFPLLQRKIDDR